MTERADVAGHARVVLCTAPTLEVAETLARGLVDAGLAACVNLYPGVRSVYRWQGALHVDDEVQMVIKTTAARFAALEQHLRAHHPYETPEILALEVADGSHAYLAWLDRQCQAPRKPT
jgi:periplasmic divalent cation tolerance protein